MIGNRAYVDRRFDDLMAHMTTMRAADTLAITAFRDELSKRLDGMNEFRKALADQAAGFVPRVEVEAQWRRTAERLDLMASEHRGFVGRSEHDALVDRLTSLDTRLTRQEGADTGSENRTTTLRQTIVVSVAILGLVMTVIVTLLDHYVSK